jgi:hypothetical protein
MCAPALLAALCACGPSEPAPSAKSASASQVPLEVAPKALFERGPDPIGGWNADNYRRLDPAADGWPLEALHDRMKPVCDEFLQALWSRDASAESLQRYLAADFEGESVLRPAELETTFDDGNNSVRRARAISAELRPPTELAALAKSLREPFDASEVRTEAWIEAIDAEDGGCSIEARVQAFQPATSGAATQQNLRLRVGWSARGENERPSLRSLALLSFEEVRTRATMFADRTARWLGRQPWAEHDFLHGLNDFYFRQDRLTGNHLLGGQGLALGDVDGDGLEDVYVCMQGGFPNRLLMHAADGSVRDATGESKLAFLENSRSALILDLDGDGARDVAVALNSNVVLAFNDGHGVFSEQHVLQNPGVEDVFSMAAADPDGDGDLDLYCTRYVQGGMIVGVPRPYYDARNGAQDVFWRNLGGRKFENATHECGFDSANDRFGLAALWEDLDDDGDLDLYVVNDFGRNNYFVNDGGKFRDVARERGADDAAAGMGISCADFDLDGHLDLYVSNMYSDAGLRLTRQHERFMDGKHQELHASYTHHARGNTLLRGLGGGRFEDVSDAMGCAAAGWAWGAMFLDFDADGYEDVFSPNGFISNTDRRDVESFFWRRVIGQSPPDASESEPYRQAWASMQSMVMNDGMSYDGYERDTAFLNLGGRSFADVSSCAGLDFLDDSRAVATCDWDDDGRLDFLLKCRTAPRVRFLRNQDPGRNHFAQIELVGTRCNRDAYGARVVLEAGGRAHTKSLHCGEGYLAQSSRRMYFGLGDAQRIAKLSVRWPDGSRSSFDDLASDVRYRIVQGEDAPQIVAPRTLRAFAEPTPAGLEPSQAPIDRFVLIEKIPLAKIRFASLDGAARRIEDLAGAPLLVTLWSASAAGSREQWSEFRDHRREIEAAGLRIAALTTDDGAALLAARQLVDELGIQSWAGCVDGNARRQFEILFIEALERSNHVPEPSSLLLDSGGQWLIGYLGPVEVETLLADVAALKTIDPRNRRAPKLLGGRWALRFERDWTTLSAVFRELGASDAAEMFRAYGAQASEEH